MAGPVLELGGRRSPAADRHAETIRIALMEAAPQGLKTPRLMASTELSRSQLVRGLAALKELCGLRGWPALLWSYEKGYYFCTDADELELSEQQWAGRECTRVHRVLLGVMTPHAKLFPKSRWVKFFSAQLNAVETALDLIAHPQLQ